MREKKYIKKGGVEYGLRTMATSREWDLPLNKAYRKRTK